jgi:uncharacterized protein
MKIKFGGQEIILHHSGMAFLPDDFAVVSDLHLEKGSHYAQRGYFLPPYDSHATLVKLLNICFEENVRRVIVLGDCFHDEEGFFRLDPLVRELFGELRQFKPIWIKGNHDGDFVPPGFQAFDIFEQAGMTFRHEAEPGAENEMSGHFHPKAQITHKGGQFERPCFIEDGRKIILPAFGAYTGGLGVNDPAIRKLFASPRIHVLGDTKIFSLPLKR